jgi:hypothetical protein
VSQVFISHSSADKERIVRRLARDLAAVGHTVWYDEWTIHPGESLAEKIDNGIQECDYFVILLSTSALKSRWVQKELSAAAVREIEKQSVFVIPVLIGSVRHDEVPVSLRSKKYVDMRWLNDKRYKRALKELVVTFGRLQDVGKDEVPVFRCPRCSHKEAESAGKSYRFTTLDIICLENEIEKDWYYDSKSGQARLFFQARNKKSETLNFRLDAQDRSRLAKAPMTPLGWFTFKRPKNKNGILKLQYQVLEKKYVSLYWINYAMEGYIEAKARQFCHDWDFEVTLGHRKNRN